MLIGRFKKKHLYAEEFLIFSAIDFTGIFFVFHRMAKDNQKLLSALKKTLKNIVPFKTDNDNKNLWKKNLIGF